MGDIVVVERKDGGRSFKARVRRRGAPMLSKTFRRKTDAKKWISHVEGKLLEGKGLPKPKRHTVAQAIDRYLLEVLPDKKPNTRAVEAPRLQFWKEQLGSLRLVEVDYETLQRAREELQTTPVVRDGGQAPQYRGPATVNRYFAVLRHVYTVAVKNWEWADSNPVSKVRSLREPKGRERTLTDDELKKILRGLEEHVRKDFRLIVLIALVTGCRRANAESIHWEHIDFERRTLCFPDTKNNRAHVSPLTEELCDELKAYQVEQEAIGGPVFPSAPGSKRPYVDVKQLWRRFTRKLGIADLRFHDLRHAVASYLAKQDVPLFTIGRILGHRSLESTKRYAHLGVADVAPHVERLGAMLQRAK